MSWSPIYLCVWKLRSILYEEDLKGEVDLGIEISYVGLCFLDLFLVPQEKFSHMINL
jgi:hypothetical protein